MEVIPLLILHLLAQTVVFDDFDEVELLDPPVGLGAVLFTEDGLEVLTVHLGILVCREDLEVLLQLVLGPQDLALLGLHFLQEFANLPGNTQVFRVGGHTLYSAHFRFSYQYITRC